MLSHDEQQRLAAIFNRGEFDALEIEAERLIDRYPDSGFAWKALGAALQKQSKVSLHAFQRAARLLPDDAEAHTNLGNALRETGKLTEAAASNRRALELEPNNDVAYCNLGAVQMEMGSHAEALASYRRATQINPENAAAHYNLGNALRVIGLHEQAVISYRKALALNPGLIEARNNLLFSLSLWPSVMADEKFEEALSFGSFVAHKAQRYRSWHNTPDPDRCLHVGLVSGDFCNHAVGYFLSGILSELAKSAIGRLKLYAYSNNALTDELTKQIIACCYRWCLVVPLSDQNLAEQVRSDGIDILVDLSGHTALNRLPMFAWQPAPVQATWLGYFATTGVDAIDFFIADPWTLPNSEERWFTERIWRLPETRFCFTVPDEDVAVAPLPALKNAYVTFACFNNLSKMNDEVVAVWAKILRSVPSSRLFLKSLQLKDPWIKEETLKRFAAHGISSDRIILEGHETRSKYLAAFHRVDIALDPFPYTGGTTTVESLWMGVPVLTLAGVSLLSRQGVGLLMNAGLPDWIAENEADYVFRAVRHARELVHLSALRQGLRKQVLSSPIFDAPRFARHFEQALRGMWRDWCADQHPFKICENTKMKAFLHVGCGPKRKDRTTAGFNAPEWREQRLDIDESVNPDIVGTMTDMSAVADASVDALFSSHNIEHLYPHEVPVALAEFKRVLKPDGFAVITCPDLQSVCALVAQDKLTEPAYTAPAGPITPLDILYGHRPPMARGNLYMAHRCGFTQKVLTGTLQAAGFAMVAARRREHPYYDLWALATVQPMEEADLRALALAHFPG